LGCWPLFRFAGAGQRGLLVETGSRPGGRLQDTGGCALAFLLRTADGAESKGCGGKYPGPRKLARPSTGEQARGRWSCFVSARVLPAPGELGQGSNGPGPAAWAGRCGSGREYVLAGPGFDEPRRSPGTLLSDMVHGSTWHAPRTPAASFAAINSPPQAGPTSAITSAEEPPVSGGPGMGAGRPGGRGGGVSQA